MTAAEGNVSGESDDYSAEESEASRKIEALRDAIRQAIAVLEQTKQNFKSKRLAELRKMLSEVLERQEK